VAIACCKRTNFETAEIDIPREAGLRFQEIEIPLDAMSTVFYRAADDFPET